MLKNVFLKSHITFLRKPDPLLGFRSKNRACFFCGLLSLYGKASMKQHIKSFPGKILPKCILLWHKTIQKKVTYSIV